MQSSEILDGWTFFYRKKAQIPAVSSLKFRFFCFFDIQMTDFAPSLFGEIVFIFNSAHSKLGAVQGLSRAVSVFADLRRYSNWSRALLSSIDWVGFFWSNRSTG